MRLLALTLLLSSAAFAGEPYTALGKPCAVIESQVPIEVLYFQSFREAFRDVLLRDSRDPVPANDAAAMKRLCGDEGCPGLVGIPFTADRPRPAPVGKVSRPVQHGILFGTDPGLYVLPDLGWRAPSACDGTRFTFSPVGDTLFLVELREADGDTSGGRQSACLSKRSTRSAMLVDLKARRVRWLVQGLGPDDSVVRGADGIHVTACGQPKRIFRL